MDFSKAFRKIKLSLIFVKLKENAFFGLVLLQSYLQISEKQNKRFFQ